MVKDGKMCVRSRPVSGGDGRGGGKGLKGCQKLEA